MLTFSEWMAAGRPQTSSLGDAGYVPEAARPIQGQRAGLFTRAAAAGIDVAATVVVMIGAWLGLWVVLWAIRPMDPHPMPQVWWFVLIGIVILWLSWTVAYATNGRALGHLVMGIRVVNRTGQSMSWLAAALRAITNMLFPVGLLWVIPSAQNRSVQDVVLRSSVIYAWAIQAPAPRDRV